MTEEIRKPHTSQVQAHARRNGTVFRLSDREAQRQRDAQLAAAAGSTPLIAAPASTRMMSRPNWRRIDRDHHEVTVRASCDPPSQEGYAPTGSLAKLLETACDRQYRVG